MGVLALDSNPTHGDAFAERLSVDSLPLFVVVRRLPTGNLVEAYGRPPLSVRAKFDSVQRLPAARGLG